MPRIYTRTGDGGETSLFGGERTAKSDHRVDLYGEIDELNSLVGLAAALAQAAAEDLAPLLDDLAAVQGRLLDLGALLADPDRSIRAARGEITLPGLDPAPMEAAIDRLEGDLPPLRAFILPGGCPAGATLHLARTVCRRTERRAVAAAGVIAVPAEVLGWLNRLSDYLFVAARWLNLRCGAAEVAWSPDGNFSGEPEA